MSYLEKAKRRLQLEVQTQLTKYVVQVIAEVNLQRCIRDVPGSNLTRVTGFYVAFLSF
jgi:hypothetical protein